MFIINNIYLYLTTVSILQNVIHKILRRRPCQNFLPGVLCVTQGHRITYRYVPQGRLWVESSIIDSGPVPFAVTPDRSVAEDYLRLVINVRRLL